MYPTVVEHDNPIEFMRFVGLIIGYLGPLKVTCISKSKGIRIYVV